MCTLCYVDDAMKNKIAAYGASFRKATQSPFGASDEIGMLNLITAESRDANLSTADAGKMLDLSSTILSACRAGSAPTIRTISCG